MFTYQTLASKVISDFDTLNVSAAPVISTRIGKNTQKYLVSHGRDESPGADIKVENSCLHVQEPTHLIAL